MELVLDQIEGAELLLDESSGSYRVRMGTVKDIDTVGEADPNVLEKALTVTGMPGMGLPMPGNTGFVLSQVGVMGLFHNAVRVRLVYRSVALVGTSASAYIVTDGSDMMEEEVSIHAGTGMPIRVGFIKPDEGPGNPAWNIAPQTVPMRVGRPIRSINLTAVVAGTPDGNKNKAGYVNSVAWPTATSGYASLGVGYWLLNKFHTQYARYTGFHQITATAITRGYRNWMMEGILMDHNTGKYAPVTQLQIQASLALPYADDVLTNLAGGLVVVGHFPLTPFADIFGF